MATINIIMIDPLTCSQSWSISPIMDRRRDLSIYTEAFRTYIQNEFKISKRSGTVADRMPTVSSTAFIQDVGLYRSFLLHTPHDLIKFRTFKRPAGSANKSVDQRLNRVQNVGRLPIGVWARWIVNNSLFTMLILSLVILNSITLGLQTELSREDVPSMFIFFELLDTASLMIFVIEIGLHWLDDFRNFWKSSWNCFDFLVTMMSAIPSLLNVLDISDGKISSLAAQLRIFRIFRSLKVVSRFRNLRLIITTILDGFSNMGFVLLLLSLMAFTFSIFAIYIFEPYSHSTIPGLVYQTKFESLQESLITLFQLFTFDHWYSIESDIRRVVNPWVTGMYFFVWIWIGAFIFKNIFVGVIVRSFQVLSKDMGRIARQQKLAKTVKKQMDQMRDKIGDSPGPDGAMNPATNTRAGVDEVEKAAEGREPYVHALNMDEAASWTALMHATASNVSQFMKEQTWPSDDLFKYWRLMMKLQENSQELLELQYLNSVALSTLNQTPPSYQAPQPGS